MSNSNSLDPRPPTPDAQLVAVGDIEAADTESLKERLTTLLARTADDLRQMAAIVGELERRGEDLSALRLGIIDHLRRIASGQLLPEIVVRFSGFPQMLRIACHLPLADQQKLAAGEPVEMAVWRGDAVDWRRVDPMCLTRDQVHQVFAGDRLRGKVEQIAYLEDRRQRRPSEGKRKARGVVRADRERGGVTVKRTFVAAADVVAALAELAAPDDETERTSSVVFKLTDDEHRQLKQAALDGATTVSDLVRRALAAHGLLRKG